MDVIWDILEAYGTDMIPLLRVLFFYSSDPRITIGSRRFGFFFVLFSGRDDGRICRLSCYVVVVVVVLKKGT